MSNYWYDSGAEDDLILEVRHERRRSAALAAHPDPRDPDYPYDESEEEDDASCDD